MRYLILVLMLGFAGCIDKEARDGCAYGVTMWANIVSLCGKCAPECAVTVPDMGCSKLRDDNTFYAFANASELVGNALRPIYESCQACVGDERWNVCYPDDEGK